MEHHGYYPDMNTYAPASGDIGQQLPLQQQQATVYPLSHHHHQAYQQSTVPLQQQSQSGQQIQPSQLYHQKNAQQMHYGVPSPHHRKHDVLDSYNANSDTLLNYPVNSGESPNGAIAQCSVDYSAVQYAKTGVEQNSTYYYPKVQAAAYDGTYGGYQNYNAAAATPSYANASSSSSSSPIVLSDYPESPKSHVPNAYGGAIKYNGYQVAAGGYKNPPAAPVAPTQWTASTQTAQAHPAKYGVVPVRHPFDDTYSRPAMYMRPGNHPYHMSQDYAYSDKYPSNYYNPATPYKTSNNGKYPVVVGSTPRTVRSMMQPTPEAPVPHHYYNMMRPGNGYQQPASQVYNRPAAHHIPQKDMYVDNGIFEDPYSAKVNYSTPAKYIPQYEDYHHHHHRHSNSQVPQQPIRSSMMPGSYPSSKIVYQGGRNLTDMCYPAGYQGNYPVSQAVQQPNRYYEAPQQTEKSYIDLEEQINSSKILKAARSQIPDYYQASHYQYLGHHQIDDPASSSQVPLKKTNVRDFLSSWNEDEEEENKQSHEHNRAAQEMNSSVNCGYGNAIYDMSRSKEFDTDGNPRIHVGITIDNNTTNQSINLPDIIIDIEKPKMIPPEDNSLLVNSEKLYVLESIDVPLSELNKYKHLSVVNKLPENIVHFANGESEAEGKEFAASVENSLKFIEEIESNHENYFKSDFEMNVEYDEKDVEPAKEPVAPVSQPERKESVIVANGEVEKVSMESAKKTRRKKKRRSSSLAVECYPIVPPKKIKTLQKLCISVINSKDFRKSYEKYLTCKRKEAQPPPHVQKKMTYRYTRRYCRRIPPLKELCQRFFVPPRQPLSLKEICESFICNHRNIFTLEEVPRVPRLSDLCEEVLKLNNFIINLDDFSEAPDGANICFDFMISTAGQELLPQPISPEPELQPIQTEENFLDMDANYFSDTDTYRLFDLCENNHIQSEEIIPVDVARDRKEKLCEYLRSKYIQRPHHERLFFVKKTIRKYFFYQRYSRILLNIHRRETISMRDKISFNRKRLKIEKKRDGACNKIPRNHKNSLNNNYSPRKSGSEGEGRDRRPPERHHRIPEEQLKRRNSSESHRVAKDLKRQHLSASTMKRKADLESRKSHKKLNFDEMLLNIDSYYTKSVGRVKSCSRDSTDSSSSSSSDSSSSSQSSSSSSSSTSSSTSSSSSSSHSSGTRSPFVKLERSVAIDKLGKMYT